MIHPRLGCSTISFRHLDLESALATIAGLGFDEIDLGALPGVCDHVPYVLDRRTVDTVTAVVTASGTRVRSVNGDIGDLNAILTGPQRHVRKEHLEHLLALASGVGAEALVLPCGALDHDPVRSLDEDLDVVAAALSWASDLAYDFGVAVWTESLHLHRLCRDITRASDLTGRLSPDIGIVMDFSHIVASGSDPAMFVDLFGPRITHVHLRDAVPGNINLSIGNGAADFACGIGALADIEYAGHFSLELETRDVTDPQRADATAAAARFISPLIP
ncbi:sugar phosphate isomerase/epimerase family protein [Rhodococcus sp. NPDC003383]